MQRKQQSPSSGFLLLFGHNRLGCYPNADVLQHSERSAPGLFNAVVQAYRRPGGAVRDPEIWPAGTKSPDTRLTESPAVAGVELQDHLPGPPGNFVAKSPQPSGTNDLQWRLSCGRVSISASI
jgi:hypothetical protein